MDKIKKQFQFQSYISAIKTNLNLVKKIRVYKYYFPFFIVELQFRLAPAPPDDFVLATSL